MKEEVNKFPTDTHPSSQQRGCLRMLCSIIERAKALESSRPGFKFQICACSGAGLGNSLILPIFSHLGGGSDIELKTLFL